MKVTQRKVETHCVVNESAVIHGDVSVGLGSQGMGEKVLGDVIASSAVLLYHC